MQQRATNGSQNAVIESKYLSEDLQGIFDPWQVVPRQVFTPYGSVASCSQSGIYTLVPSFLRLLFSVALVVSG